MKRALLNHAKLSGTNLEGAIIYGTRVYRKADLVDARGLQSYEGFVFEEEEREKRDKRADELFKSKELGHITFRLPDTYGPAQVGRVLILTTLLYEGVRIALTEPFKSMDELRDRVLRPELYGAYEDKKYVLKINEISSGSLLADLTGQKGVNDFIAGLLTLPDAVRLRRLQLRRKIAQEKMKLEELEGEQKAEVEERALIADTGIIPLTDRQIEDLNKKIESLGSVDHLEERRTAAIIVIVKTIDELSLLFNKLSGEMKIDDFTVDFTEREDDRPDAKASKDKKKTKK